MFVTIISTDNKKLLQINTIHMAMLLILISDFHLKLKTFFEAVRLLFESLDYKMSV